RAEAALPLPLGGASGPGARGGDPQAAAARGDRPAGPPGGAGHGPVAGPGSGEGARDRRGDRLGPGPARAGCRRADRRGRRPDRGHGGEAAGGPGTGTRARLGHPARRRLRVSGPADPLVWVQGFVAALRRAGVPVAQDRLPVLVRALDALGPGELYWAGRLTLCATPDDLARYDAVWRELTGGRAGRGSPRPRVPAVRRAAAPLIAEAARPGADRAPGQPPAVVAARASTEEVLRHRDLAGLTGEELAEVRRLLALLAPATPLRRSRRRRRAPAGRVDAHRTMRAMLRGLGEPVRLARR